MANGRWYMEHKMRPATLRGEHGGEVVGWVRPRLSGEEEAAIRERLIRRGFEHVDEYLLRIDECLRELARLGALDAEAVDAIRAARSELTRLDPKGPSSHFRRASTPKHSSPVGEPKPASLS